MAYSCLVVGPEEAYVLDAALYLSRKGAKDELDAPRVNRVKRPVNVTPFKVSFEFKSVFITCQGEFSSE